MKKFILAFLITLSFCNIALAVRERYSFDREHTSITFSVDHNGYSQKIGRFLDYYGYLLLDEDDPSNSYVDVSIRIGGLETDSAALNKVLRGKDWFNSVKYPVIKFTSSYVTITGKGEADIVGWLDMLGNIEPVTLHAKLNRIDYSPVTGRYTAGFTADATIYRSRFGMLNYVPMVGDDVKIHIELEAIRQ